MPTKNLICTRCNRNSEEAGTLFSLYAPGIAYMCGDCIADEEKKTGRHGIFFYSGGLRFLTDDEATALPMDKTIHKFEGNENESW